MTGEKVRVTVLFPRSMERRVLSALRDLTPFLRETVGVEELGLGTVEEPREYARWVAHRVSDHVAEEVLHALFGNAGALAVRVDEFEYHVIVGPAYGSQRFLRAGLAHEFAHIFQHRMGLFPSGLRAPAGAARSVLLPLEVGAEELVLRRLPEVGEDRIELARREGSEWRRTGDPLLDLENALITAPVNLALRRLGREPRVPEPRVDDEEVSAARRRLVRSAARVDPWDREQVREYVEWASGWLLRWLSDRDYPRHHSTSD
ncbi:MAG: hypothetical protein ABGY09_01170 [Euryarchaeota archaeon]